MICVFDVFSKHNAFILEDAAVTSSVFHFLFLFYLFYFFCTSTIKKRKNIRRARLEGEDQYGGSNRFCGGVVSAGLCAIYGAHADGTDPEMVDLNAPR